MQLFALAHPRPMFSLFRDQSFFFYMKEIKQLISKKANRTLTLKGLLHCKEEQPRTGKDMPLKRTCL